MEKKTIGKFISALRRAQGLTQKELGDMLYVSDKTVSRWERDECTPDLSLLPALADIFGITVDELLRGERNRLSTEVTTDVTDTNTKEDNQRKRGDKQWEIMLNRRTTRFKLLSLITIGLGILTPIITSIMLLTIDTVKAQSYFNNYTAHRDSYKAIDFAESLASRAYINVGISVAVFAICIIAQICFAIMSYMSTKEEDSIRLQSIQQHNHQTAQITIGIFCFQLTVLIASLLSPFTNAEKAHALFNQYMDLFNIDNVEHNVHTTATTMVTNIHFISMLGICLITLIVCWLIYTLIVRRLLVNHGVLLPFSDEQAKTQKTWHGSIAKHLGVFGSVAVALIVGMTVINAMSPLPFTNTVRYKSYEHFEKFMSTASSRPIYYTDNYIDVSIGSEQWNEQWGEDLAYLREHLPDNYSIETGDFYYAHANGGYLVTIKDNQENELCQYRHPAGYKISFDLSNGQASPIIDIYTNQNIKNAIDKVDTITLYLIFAVITDILACSVLLSIKRYKLYHSAKSQ